VHADFFATFFSSLS